MEDEADVVDLLRYNLERADFEVQIAMTGDLGLAMAREKRPDLIVLDLMLPGMNGHEVCRALKGDPNTEVIPIVMLLNYKPSWIFLRSRTQPQLLTQCCLISS